MFRYKEYEEDKGYIICVDCAEELVVKGIIGKQHLRDYFEDEDITFNEVDLRKCCRVRHDRPRCHFVKYRKKDNIFVYGTQCTYCKNMKRIENSEKIKRVKRRSYSMKME